MASTQQVTDPEVLAAASKCPYIQQVVAEVGDAQMVSNSLGPFLTLASAARAAAGGAGIGEAAPMGGSATAPSGTGSGDSRPAGAGPTEFGTKDAPPTDEQAEAATEAATAL
ncbi:g11781 [Coccomyxa viridis]|uniref:G11781 protein n=1 Tax=Coccomyxa viridis TaxID=1274662 RepID=A0ABP1GBD4_9CHLO